ncbi:MAG: hypothetical protein AUJ52_08420 [Elusimicrobia bacterium CG1_02_63_36]|nr:MAG: hypothetical protein AUJ52_08420 [Elusimicrobia bacterium CG1_02_63_36]PIP83230.1 MAG: hypothetical protein COR54_10730 [Elusimicrobia bacterium CG22_combo_CG10-13_8_21_14_all_63_91]PJA17643.1 MAG: hypothetical protein COX66_03830 [Elusimicrobia bacterium CG_4_10_14_0_2_um_filter_63_34]PJB26279.1 MAG: hypothetical protein CO113_04415 [Elusimicrobia bacterium CG_4_9_14_3_um_filter_62_55]
MRQSVLTLLFCFAALPCKGESASMDQLGALRTLDSGGSVATFERLREEAAFETGVRPGRTAFAPALRPSEGRTRRRVDPGESRKRAVEAGAVLLGLAGLIAGGPAGLLAGAAIGAVLGAIAFLLLG